MTSNFTFSSRLSTRREWFISTIKADNYMKDYILAL